MRVELTKPDIPEMESTKQSIPEVGIIAPVEYLQFTNPKLALCYSIFLEEPKYRKFFEKVEASILDYSPELPRKRGLSKESLVRALKTFSPTYVLFPSIDYAYDKTLLIARGMADIVGTKGIGTLEGYDLESLRKCYIGLAEICDKIALPSALEKIGRRDEIIRDLGIKEATFYLEVDTNPFEEIPFGNTLGICTSFPLRLAQYSRTLLEYKPMPKQLNFKLSPGELDLDLAEDNVKDYIRVVREGLAINID